MNQGPTAWIGNTESSKDNISEQHVARVALSLDSAPPTPGEGLPPLWHWAFFIDAQPYAALGKDGHPQRGDFLPPANNRNRMWAGGRIHFHKPLQINSASQRHSTIENMVEKQGRSGKLLFVTVKHEYIQNGIACISEEQDIVYREPGKPVLQGTQPAPAHDWSETFHPEPVVLFRYSAVTYNGHRIHYDAPYARDVEGYPGLVVHGPLLATLMVRAFGRAHPEAKVTCLSYRGLRPLIAPTPFQLAGKLDDPGRATLWAEQDGMLAHRAEIQFEQ